MLDTKYYLKNCSLAAILSVIFVFNFATLLSGQEPPAATGSKVELRDELAPTATWRQPSKQEISAAFETWLSESEFDKKVKKRATAFLDSRLKSATLNELVDTIIQSAALARPDLNQVIDTLKNRGDGIRPPEFSSILENAEEKAFLRDHTRLYYGRWLAQNQFYDEALLQLNQIKIDQVLDRGTLLFYRGLMEHQLLKKEECLKTVNQLLEQSQSLPRRYTVLSKLMLADIKPLEADSLDEISRMMSDIRRRTKLLRSGKIVLNQEEEVIKKLDKLIEELESQQKSQQAANSIVPSSPMDDSRKAAGKGSGKVTSKRQTDGGDWGDVPPAERAAALAEMAKDMPPHYRAVIEEYFKQLAEQDQ